MICVYSVSHGQHSADAVANSSYHIVSELLNSHYGTKDVSRMMHVDLIIYKLQSSHVESLLSFLVHPPKHSSQG